MEEEIQEIVEILKTYQPEYITKLLKKLRQSSKSRFRSITRKYIKEQGIKFEICADCGCNGYIEIHHLNYTNPYIISPLCKTCHGAQHRKQNKEIWFVNLKTGEWFYDRFRVH